MRPIILIPARMSSTRLPGKPLLEVEGVSCDVLSDVSLTLREGEKDQTKK